MVVGLGQFGIKLGVIQLLPKFHSLDSESVHLHLKELEHYMITSNLHDKLHGYARWC